MTDSVRTVCCMGASPEHFRSLFVLPARKSNFNQAAESWRIKQNSSSHTQNSTALSHPLWLACAQVDAVAQSRKTEARYPYTEMMKRNREKPNGMAKIAMNNWGKTQQDYLCFEFDTGIVLLIVLLSLLANCRENLADHRPWIPRITPLSCVRCSPQRTPMEAWAALSTNYTARIHRWAPRFGQNFHTVSP